MASPARTPLPPRLLPSRELHPQPPAAPREDEIQARAYEIYLREGARDGEHERHWAQAIEELIAERSCAIAN